MRADKATVAAIDILAQGKDSASFPMEDWHHVADAIFEFALGRCGERLDFLRSAPGQTAVAGNGAARRAEAVARKYGLCQHEEPSVRQSGYFRRW